MDAIPPRDDDRNYAADDREVPPSRPYTRRTTSPRSYRSSSGPRTYSRTSSSAPKRAPARKPPAKPGQYTYKSRGETLIAAFLKDTGIKFLYEYPLIIIDDDNKIRVWYPDFWLPELSIVVEYFGMVNDEQYREQMVKKQDLYKKLDIDFIGLDTNMVQLDKNWEKFIVMRIMEIMDSKRPIYKRLEELKRKYTW